MSAEKPERRLESVDYTAVIYIEGEDRFEFVRGSTAVWSELANGGDRFRPVERRIVEIQAEAGRSVFVYDLILEHMSDDTIRGIQENDFRRYGSHDWFGFVLMAREGGNNEAVECRGIVLSDDPSMIIDCFEANNPGWEVVGDIKRIVKIPKQE